MLQYVYKRVCENSRKNKLNKKENNFIVSRYYSFLIKSTAFFLERYYLINKTNEIGIEKPDDKDAPVVSLTSFPARIENVWITIETLLRQTRKPHAVVLYLSEKQFLNRRDDLPKRLLSLEERGLQIRFVSEDYRSHKKFYYAFSEYTDRDVITVDDDLFYPYDTVEKLIELSNINKKKVCCTVGHMITRNNDGAVMPYNKWVANPVGSDFGKDICPIGIGGVLYPKGDYRLDMLKPDIFMEACKFADDLWLKLVCEKNGVDAVKLNYRIPGFPILKSQKESLSAINNRNDMNTQQWKNIEKAIDFIF